MPPLIFILAETKDEYCEVEAFRAGADDYIVLPLQERAFEFRVKAFIRRLVEYNGRIFGESEIVRLGEVVFDKRSFVIYNDGEKYYLTQRESELLLFFIAHPNQLFSREDLAARFWEGQNFNVRGLDVLIHRLRQKVGAEKIQTIKNNGYIFLS